MLFVKKGSQFLIVGNLLTVPRYLFVVLGIHQRSLYNGHKRVLALKYQAVSAPNGLCANLSGPYEGKKHDSSMLMESGLLTELYQHSHDSNGNILCIYGDPAYPLRPQLMAPFAGNLTQDQKNWNMSMCSVRVSVEWLFGDIKNYFKFLDFKKDLKVIGYWKTFQCLCHLSKELLIWINNQSFLWN